jgi:hypothetical protein
VEFDTSQEMPRTRITMMTILQADLPSAQQDSQPVHRVSVAPGSDLRTPPTVTSPSDLEVVDPSEWLARTPEELAIDPFEVPPWDQNAADAEDALFAGGSRSGQPADTPE